MTFTLSRRKKQVAFWALMVNLAATLILLVFDVGFRFWS